jgi:hypothetical protein
VRRDDPPARLPLREAELDRDPVRCVARAVVLPRADAVGDGELPEEHEVRATDRGVRGMHPRSETVDVPALEHVFELRRCH